MLTSPKPWFSAACRAKSGQGFLRDDRGASALEFALIAAPLIMLLLGIVQVGYIYFANFALDEAVANGARLIRTGQAQTKGLDAAKFKEELCKNLVGPVVCGGVKLDVRSYDNFAAAASGMTAPLGADGKINNNLTFDPGNPEDVVVVRAFYPLELGSLFPSALGLGAMANMADGNRLLVSTAAFRNEPYQ
ncbi:TadE/TadG family type IV pilus assembly protein [Methyloceanibacter sp.]|uniref:TadE/TadG family type IV pilus assembly protein n=1 Tax=Methyloceanibacter sp. TaxID=1965321 RepID=UPI0025D1D6B2|nr:TadE/TadG family type IV pilus assembly protein [Methyloceanibacter sp.]